MGLQAARKFPGFSAASGGYQAGFFFRNFAKSTFLAIATGFWSLFANDWDTNVSSYPSGQIEVMPGGVRFHSNGKAHTARVHEEILVFHTPRMTSWILNQAKRAKVTP